MHVAIAGNIGSGKTTLAQKLGKDYNWNVELESVEDNPYLKDFYEDMSRWSFHLQVYFLNSRFKQIAAIQESVKGTIQDRTIYEDAHIFAANLKQSGFISDRDYQNYLELFKSMIKYVQPPDLLIYLKADIPKLVGNIQKRGRDYEELIRIEYLKNLNSHYENWIGNYDMGKLLIVDVNNLDFVSKVEDYSLIVEKVNLEINGLFS
ncbi:deoxynucleoside kinase [Roseivirga seohaensis]|uniref:Deoxynucleoside kinase n=2 Tax=Roseivirga seohaensis TaxID=1914963 RepID=A0A0L8APQ6_9BACT|nr:deoxynucleoside kinase [Roseivirga seohaensis]KOF04221.1 deoxynucleoside kinase [Roseivirga seohaensis subsp. aquiponti]KYG80312.1 deoxynucleoside kinase [Roseivirga seohaensis]|tara:strand:+ start:1298 stop:1915 length:618 start_codon:yes stop_codon:yes gene_type:complete